MSGLLGCSDDRPSPTAEACDEITYAIEALPDAEAYQRSGSFQAFTGPSRRHGCVVHVQGTTRADQPVPVIATTLPDSLGRQWRRDDMLVADGPAETVYGLWRGDVLCLVRVRWGRAPESGSAPAYTAEIGCESLPDHVVPRS